MGGRGGGGHTFTPRRYVYTDIPRYEPGPWGGRGGGAPDGPICQILRY